MLEPRSASSYRARKLKKTSPKPRPSKTLHTANLQTTSANKDGHKQKDMRKKTKEAAVVNGEQNGERGG